MRTINSCCCLSARTGATIIAILEIVLSFIFFGVSLFTITTLAIIHVVAQNETAMQEVKKRIDYKHPGSEDEEPEAVFVTLYIILGLSCLLCVIQIIFGALLLRGIRNERLKLLKMWMVFKASSLVFSVIFTIVMASMQKRSKTYGEILADVVSILIGQYFIFVVYQLYKEMWTNLQNQMRPKRINRPEESNQEQYGWADKTRAMNL